MPLKFTISGLRGVWKDGIDLEVILDYSKRFIYYLNTKSNSGKVIVLGRDTRKTSPIIHDFVSAVVRAYGFSVIDLGIITTPMVLFAVRELKAQGGIIVTASHNPPQWNALKFVDSGGVFVQQNVIDFMSSPKEVELTDWNEVGIEKNLNQEEVLDLFFDKVQRFIDVSIIKNRKFKVAFDPVNGAGTYIGKLFLEKLNCEVFTIHSEVDKFPERETEPTQSALERLSEVVLEKRCDVGFALDPDGDRLAIVFENGFVPSEEYTLPLSEISAIEYLGRYVNSKKIVINLSTSSLSEFVAQKYGFEVIRTKVGEANVVKELIESGGFIGGEGNGGVIFPLINSARDSFVGMLLILLLMAQTNKKVSELASSLPNLKMVKTKFMKFEDSSIKNIVNAISNKFRLISENDIDGYWFKFSHGWIHIRNSNTEPITRVIFEGNDEFVNYVSDVLKSINLI
ncbi:MAG: phosphoglucosamine mutase [Brevinematia bacterium]